MLLPPTKPVYFPSQTFLTVAAPGIAADAGTVYEVIQRRPVESQRRTLVSAPRRLLLLVTVRFVVGSTDTSAYELLTVARQSVRLHWRHPGPKMVPQEVIRHASSRDGVLTPLPVYDVQPVMGIVCGRVKVVSVLGHY